MPPSLLALPVEVQGVLQESRTCELTTLAKDGHPITWPVMVVPRLDQDHFLLSTAIGLSQKAHHIRRDGRVAMLFSDPTGSGLPPDAPAVLVQGDAQVGAGIVTWDEDVREYHRHAWLRQPMSRVYSFTPIGRWLMGWYFRRLVITVRATRISWWPHGDFSAPAAVLE